MWGRERACQSAAAQELGGGGTLKLVTHSYTACTGPGKKAQLVTATRYDAVCQQHLRPELPGASTAQLGQLHHMNDRLTELPLPSALFARASMFA